MQSGREKIEALIAKLRKGAERCDAMAVKLIERAGESEQYADLLESIAGRSSDADLEEVTKGWADGVDRAN